jgi:hypothetical protein
MPLSQFATGAQLTIIGTEHFVSDVNQVGTYTFHVDTNTMVAGDVLELRVYQMNTTGGTARQAGIMIYYGLQPDYDKIKISVPISTNFWSSSNNSLEGS